MQFSLVKSSKLPYFDQIKNQLTAALHMGELKHRHRLPTVRTLARTLGLNPKTVLKIYHRLQEEGLIEIRAGSGARVGSLERENFEQSYLVSLVSMVDRHLDEARRLQFSPQNYLALLHDLTDARRRPDISCLVVECNTEQIQLFASEIASRTGAVAHPVLINDLLTDGRRFEALIAKASFLITTDFHWKDVKKIADQHHKIPLKIRLRPEFVSTIIQCARKGGILMVVSNLDYFSNFRNALRALGYQSVIGRIHSVLSSDEAHLPAKLAQVKYIYVSPLCGKGFLRHLPPHLQVIQFPKHLSEESLDSLRMAMLTHHLRRILPPGVVSVLQRPYLHPAARRA